MFAEPPPAPPDCWAQDELLTAGRLHALGSVWFGACLAMLSTGADDFPDVVTGVKGLGMLFGACAGAEVWGRQRERCFTLPGGFSSWGLCPCPGF